MKGYKIFDENMKCRGYQYEVGKTYKHDGKIELCQSGFHFCRKPKYLFNYYAFNPKNRVCEIRAAGRIIHGEDKSVCSQIKIVRELSWNEVLELVNIGAGNTGYANVGENNAGSKNVGDDNVGNSNVGDDNVGNGNAGSYNAGDGNAGSGNAGSHNAGSHNAGSVNAGSYNAGSNNVGWNNVGNSNVGSYNAGSNNVGDLNLGDGWVGALNPPKEHPIYFFGKLSDWTMEKWRTSWERQILKQIFSCEKNVRQKFWDGLQEEKQLVLSLPNFSVKIFYDITGIRI